MTLKVFIYCDICKQIQKVSTDITFKTKDIIKMELICPVCNHYIGAIYDH